MFNKTLTITDTFLTHTDCKTISLLQVTKKRKYKLIMADDILLTRMAEAQHYNFTFCLILTRTAKAQVKVPLWWFQRFQECPRNSLGEW